MKKALFLGLFFIMGLVTISCGSSFNKKSYTKGTVRGAYFDWVNEIEHSGGHPEKVVELYSQDAILLPTLSPDICDSQKMITKYFSRLLLFKNLQVDTQELISRQYGDIAMNTGLYNFTYTEDGQTKKIRARFDFWYKKIDGKWKIIFHQSSILPDQQ